MRTLLAERIETQGPLPFETFMEIALYHPDGGFFSGPTLRSDLKGDFLTSPEVSLLFGKMLGRFVEGQRERIGEPFRLVEAGAGSGSLLEPMLAVCDVEAWAVEVSPPARDLLAVLLGTDRVVSNLEELGSLRGVIVANELLDNLPMALAQLTDAGWRERWVAQDGGELVLVDADPRPEVVSWLDRFAGPVSEGGWVEVQMAATRWVSGAVERLVAGALVVIDYGDLAENLVRRRPEGTLRTYRGHHLGPDPLAEPGATDITADVNFSAVMAAAEEAGARVHLARQDDFLNELGLEAEIVALRRGEMEAAAEGESMEQMRLRSLRTGAETLLHPRGLGDFRVMVAEI